MAESLLTIFAKSFIVDVWLGAKQAFVLYWKSLQLTMKIRKPCSLTPLSCNIYLNIYLKSIIETLEKSKKYVQS